MTDWQQWEMPFAGSLETRIDRKQLPAPNFLELKNAEFNTRGAITKRNGYTALSQSVFSTTPGGVTSVGTSLASRGDELVMFGKNNLNIGGRGMSWSPTENEWIDKGAVQPIDVSSEAISAQAGIGLQSASSASIGNFLCHVYGILDGAGSGSYVVTLIDTVSGVTILDKSVLNPLSIATPQVVALGTDFIIIVPDPVPAPQELRFYRIDTTDPDLVVTLVDALPDAFNPCARFDALAFSATQGIIAYGDLTGALVRIRIFDRNGYAGITTSEAVPVPNPVLGVGVGISGGITHLLVVWGTGAAIRGREYDATLTPTTAAANMGAVVPMRIAINGVTRFSYDVFFDTVTTVTSPSDFYSMFSHLLVSTTGGVISSGITNLFPNAVLGSKPVSRSSVNANATFVAVEHIDNIYAAQYLVQVTRTPISLTPAIAVIISRVCVGKPVNFLQFIAIGTNVGSPALPSSTSMLVPTVRLYRQENTQSLTSSVYNLDLQSYEFTSNKGVVSQALGPNLFANAGMLYEYDGAAFVEQGFHWSPSAVRFVSASATGGNLSDGTYYVSALYAWHDASGQRHLSAPSLPLTVTLSGGGAIQSFVVSAKTLGMTAKSGVMVYFYVSNTTIDGIYYYAAQTPNSITATTVNGTLTVVTVANEQLYTNGGILENTALPSPDIIHVRDNRIFAIVNGRDLWFSKKYVIGDGVAFSDLLSFPAPSTGGKAVTLGSVDDYLAIFKETEAYILSEEGPNALGYGTFAGPRRITVDSGCDTNSPASVVTTQDGITFKGAKGFYLLGRDFAAAELDAMSRFQGYRVVNISRVPNKTQLRYIITNGITTTELVYDYHERRWGESTLVATPVGSSSYQGRYAWVSSSGVAYIENDTYDDPGVSSLPLQVDTGWIHIAGIEGYQRVRRFGVVGENVNGTLEVRVYFDYNETAAETYVLTAAATTGNANFRQRLARQRCQAIKFSLRHTAESAADAMQLSSIMLELGVIPYIYRRDAA